MSRRPVVLLFVTASLLLSSCVVGPAYKRPVVNTPPALRGQPAPGSESIADLPWWEVFHDETLSGLIRTALGNNNDLRIAVTRIEQARLALARARADYLPGVGYEVGTGGGQNVSLANPVVGDGGRRATGSSVVAAVWEADVWGRIRRLNEAARADYLRSEYARRGVLLSLVSEVAAAYMELLGLDLRLEIARRNVQAFEESYRLFDERLRGGTASRLETERARAAAAATASNIPQLEQLIAVQENQLRILLGEVPAPVGNRGTLLAQILPPDVPAGLPSSLLERRPDILAAESEVRAANASIGIATAAYFPSVGLTALLGKVSSPLEDYLAGKTSVWGGATTAAGPLFAGGSLRARKRQAVAAWQESVIRYEQTVLGAFRDVSDALIAREKLQAVRAFQLEAVYAYREAVAVARQRYEAGKSSYFEVLDAQLRLFPAENALADTELQTRLTVIRLYQALGGGWKLTPDEWRH